LFYAVKPPITQPIADHDIDDMERNMLKFISTAVFGLLIATSAQALTRAPLHQPDSTITQVKGVDCGPDMTFYLGHCVASESKPVRGIETRAKRPVRR
jgi:hypothetical protein